MIPTITNTDHVCFTVPDLDQAVEFFTEVIGGKLVFQIGPFSVDERSGSGDDAAAAIDPDWMYTKLRMHPRSSLNAALVQLGPNFTLELYEVDAPDQNTEHPRPHDIGAPHLAFRVTDIEQATEYLRGVEGVTLHGEPEPFAEGPIAGMKWLHFESPWGLVIEIDQWPDTMPFEADTDARWTPFHDSWERAGS